MAPKPQYDEARRAQVISLKALGRTNAEIERLTHVPRRTIQHIWKRALDRGYNPSVDPAIQKSYVVNAAKPGRPKKIRDQKGTDKNENENVNATVSEKTGSPLDTDASAGSTS